MNTVEIKQKVFSGAADGERRQKGSALIIAIFVLALISVFVALALSRTATEAAAVGNETSDGRAFYAAQGSLEMMTRNFNKVFEIKLNPTDADFDAVRDGLEPGLSSDYDFVRQVDRTSASTIKVLPDTAYAGLYATQDNWRLTTTATDKTNGAQVQLTRNILNNRIPIFQFGIFYNDDLEFHPGPRFDFGGRVHSNGSLFLMAQTGLYFSSRVSAVGEILTDTARNGVDAARDWDDNVFIKNGANDVKLEYGMGSVLKSPANGTPVFDDPYKPKLRNPDMPVVYTNADWAANEAKFGGNLLAHQNPLDLPLKLAAATDNADYIDLIKRGKNVGDLYNNKTGTPTAPIIVPVDAATDDADVTVNERYYNKPGIRVSLADSKAKLPGCASGVGMTAIAGVCGKRLDGDLLGDSEAAIAGTRGYQPLPMVGGYLATRLNAERFGTTGGSNASRQMWIKIELVSRNPATNAVIVSDVTADILSLGVTEPAPNISNKFEIKSPANYYASGIDTRSVIKLQRYAMPGANFVDAASQPYMRNFAGWSGAFDSHSIVLTDDNCSSTFVFCTPVNNVFSNEDGHKQNAVVDDKTKYRKVVPFPIEMFDSREGIYNSDNAVLNTAATYNANVPWAGVMSMIDIDVANLKRFLDGNLNANMPVATLYAAVNGALQNTDVPQDGGWVLYISDRRGDGDFDGEYDMEDIYGNNDNTRQTGEDVNANNSLDTNYNNEAVRYTTSGLFTPSVNGGGLFNSTSVSGSFVAPGFAASVDHPFYRRGVRLMNARTLPGIYDAANAANTRGLSVASENGVYVQGDYNASGIVSVGTPTASTDYLPLSTSSFDVPASIVGDAVTILSNYSTASKDGWLDSNSFLYPFNAGSGNRRATETFARFAMLAGDAKSSFEASPNQGAADVRLGGGVHNFKRFLEDWGGVRLNYTGSLINLYNARNNNGSYKNSAKVYSPPTRNWVFDASFLDPARLPPGTPYFQFVQTTGFQRTND